MISVLECSQQSHVVSAVPASSCRRVCGGTEEESDLSKLIWLVHSRVKKGVLESVKREEPRLKEEEE